MFVLSIAGTIQRLERLRRNSAGFAIERTCLTLSARDLNIRRHYDLSIFLAVLACHLVVISDPVVSAAGAFVTLPPAGIEVFLIQGCVICEMTCQRALLWTSYGRKGEISIIPQNILYSIRHGKGRYGNPAYEVQSLAGY